MGKQRQLLGSALPYRFRDFAIPEFWECKNSHNMKIFCRKPYRSQAEGF